MDRAELGLPQGLLQVLLALLRGLAEQPRHRQLALVMLQVAVAP